MPQDAGQGQNLGQAGQPTQPPVTATPVPNPTPQPPLGAPVATQAPVTQQADQGQPAQPQAGRVVTLPQSAMKRIKEEHRTKGKQEGMLELAKQAGFQSVEELQAALSGLRLAPPRQAAQQQAANGDEGDDPAANNPPPPEPRQAKPDKRDQRQQNGGPPDRDWAKFMSQYDRVMKEKEQLSQQATYEKSRRKELQAALDAKDAEMALREAAVMAGIRDVDYAVRLLTRHLDGKSEEELAAFNEHGFFAGLRDQHPYLFGEVVRPATTGTGMSGPAAPKPGEQVRTQVANGQVDANKLTREQYDALLRARGLNVGL